MSQVRAKLNGFFFLLLLLALGMISYVLPVYQVFGQSEPPCPTVAVGESKPPEEQPKRKYKQAQKAKEVTETRPSCGEALNTPDGKANANARTDNSGNDPSRDGNAAEWRMVDLTGIMIGVMFAQFALFWWQLSMMRRGVEDAETMAEAAKKSADAANLTAQIMKDTAERQLRAYVSIKEGWVFFDQDSTLLRTAIMIENCGQSPAYNFKIWSDCVVAPSEGFAFEIPEEDPRPSSIVGPNGVCAINLERPITALEITAIASGIKSIYVFGKIDYEDCFGTSRYHIFRYCMSGAIKHFTVRDVGRDGWGLHPHPKGHKAT